MPRTATLRLGIITLACLLTTGASSFLLSACLLAQENAAGNKPSQQTQKSAKNKKPQPFQWVNRPKTLPVGVQHATFMSPSLKVDVGYCIYLPPQYDSQPKRQFPVVYYLHGGRPGSEAKAVKLATTIHSAIEKKKVAPMIYVFVNGGPVSHYNMPNQPKAQGADVFIKELIPHIDQTYRTIATREGRGIEGFSQGGRGTTRLMFRYPELFCSAAPGGAGHATEKRISEEKGRESEKLTFGLGDNTYDLAREFAKQNPRPNVPILIHVGTKGFNYENNLAYMQFLDGLDIPYQRLIVDGAPHSAQKIYDAKGTEIMRFHAKNFGLWPK